MADCRLFNLFYFLLVMLSNFSSPSFCVVITLSCGRRYFRPLKWLSDLMLKFKYELLFFFLFFEDAFIVNLSRYIKFLFFNFARILHSQWISHFSVFFMLFFCTDYSWRIDWAWNLVFHIFLKFLLYHDNMHAPFFSPKITRILINLSFLLLFF